MKRNEKLVQLSRGFYMLPILAHLGKEGILNEWINGKTTVGSFVESNFKKQAIIDYLVQCEVINIKEHTIQLTEFGESLTKRHGALNILHSYADYFRDIDNLFDENSKPQVDRVENVYGSGQVHNLKYFNEALELIEKKQDYHIDIACGDGTFLSQFNKSLQPKASIGVDLSNDSIKSSKTNLKMNNLKLIQANGLNVKSWAKSLDEIRNENGIISMWFFLHEVSNNDPEVLKKLLIDLNQEFPNFSLLICENVALSNEQIKEENNSSLVPEFLLFHKLSNQGVLTWKHFQDILANSPYELKKEIRYNTFGEDKIPSSFTWLLTPKKLVKKVA